MFDFSKDYNYYPSTFSQFCDEIDVGKNRMFNKLTELGILNEYRMPMPEYEKYFIPYENKYTRDAGKPSYCVTDEGKEFIKGLLTEEDYVALKKSKNARSRPKMRYRAYN